MSVVIMFFVGSWLDGLWGTEPWVMVAAMVFGIAAGMYHFIRTAIAAGKSEDQA